MMATRKARCNWAKLLLLKFNHCFFKNRQALYASFLFEAASLFLFLVICKALLAQ